MRTLTSIFLALTLAVLTGCQADVIRIYPGADVQEQLQEALITVKPGGIIELAEGTFELTDSLSLSVAGVTLRGMGHQNSILSFSNMLPGSGGEGLTVTSDNVMLEDFAILNTRSDGIKVKGVKNIQMLNLRVEWSRGPHVDNGAYGLYPVESDGVLVDGCLVSGASDAGIYVGQSRNIVVRNSEVMLNVAGIEIENSVNANVYDNVATQNTSGILVFDLPDLPMKGGGNVRVYKNLVYANETENFGKPGAIVSSVPKGTGMIITANENVEVYENQIHSHSTAAITISTYANETKDADYYPHPEAIYIHNNQFGRTGWKPDTKRLPAIVNQALQGKGGVILWDGVIAEKYNGTLPAPRGIYIQNNNYSDDAGRLFINISLKLQGQASAEDLSAHRGELPVKVTGNMREF